MTLYGDVVFPLPLARSFLYAVPEPLAGRAVPGVRVRAPLGRKVLTGFLIAVRGEAAGPGFAVKPVLEVLDDRPLFSPAFLEFTASLAAAFLASQGEFLDAALPPSFDPRETRRAALTPAGLRALEEGGLAGRERAAAALLVKGAYAPRYLERRLGGSGVPALLSRLVRKGLVELRPDPPKPRRMRAIRPAGLGPLQLEIGFGRPSEVPPAVAEAEAALAAGRHRELYLWGGDSARRGVLVRLTRRALDLGGRALVLVPEIAPAEALIAELRRLLGEDAAVFHSRQTPAGREAEWRKLRDGRAAVAVGPRSALFAPLDGLRLAAVDAEHEESLVQDESPTYDAREGARLRARAEGAVLVLGSATPSVASLHRAVAAGVAAELEREPRRNRIGVAADDGRGRGILGPELREKVGRRLAAGERVILFLNRRGTASFVVCARCGEIPRCPRCRSTLSLHGRENALVCHACGYRMPAPDGCPDCAGPLRPPRRTGIQALEEEARRLFAGVPAASFDTDSVRGRVAGEAVLDKFRAGRLPLLLGTQMLARRLEAPAARLVGVVAPETGLGVPDYRAAERTHATLARMLEFAEDDPAAEAVIQTAASAHHAIAAAAARDYRAFYEREIELRRLLRTPPFAAMAEVVFRGSDARALGRRARGAAARLRAAAPEVEILGPALAPPFAGRPGPALQLTLRAGEREGLLAALRSLADGGRSRVTITILG